MRMKVDRKVLWIDYFMEGKRLYAIKNETHLSLKSESTTYQRPISLLNYLNYGPKDKNGPPESKWFKIQFKTLKDHDLLTEFPENLFPIKEEYIWFTEDFLIDYSWINESLIADEEVYILKGDHNFLLQPYTERKIQGRSLFGRRIIFRHH